MPQPDGTQATGGQAPAPNSAEVRGKVVTTGHGHIASAVRHRLREAGWEVVALGRGDDLRRHVRDAEAVVVLDGARRFVSPADYRLALDAVGQALRRSRTTLVVSVARIPPGRWLRSRFEADADRAEHAFSTVVERAFHIWCGVVVGTQENDGPTDDRLFATGRSMRLRGDGEQRLRPIRIDNLAAIVCAALEAPAPPPAERRVVAEGPSEMSMRHLLAGLNHGVTLVRRRERIAPVERLTRLLDGVNRSLPRADFLLDDAADPRPRLGVELEPVLDAWPAQGSGVRRPRSKRQKPLRRYALAQWLLWVAVFLLLLALSALVVGTHDLMEATSVPPTLNSVGLIVAGLAMLGGGLGLLGRWRLRYPAAFLASAVAALMLLLVLAGAILNGDAPALGIVGCGTLAALAVGIGVALWRRTGLVPDDFLAGAGRKLLGPLALAVVSGLVPIFYNSVYLPTTATPFVTVTANLEAGARVAGTTQLAGHVRLENPADDPVVVASATYTLEAIAMRPLARVMMPEERSLDSFERLLWSERPASMTTERSERVIVQRGLIARPGVYLGPGQAIERRVVAMAPSGKGVVSLRVDLVLLRRRLEGVVRDPLEARPSSVGPVAVTVARVDDPFLLHRVTRSPRYVHVVEALGTRLLRLDCGGSGRRVMAWVDGERETRVEGRRCEEGDRRLREYYGLQTTHTTTEVVVAQRGGAAPVSGTGPGSPGGAAPPPPGRPRA